MDLFTGFGLSNQGTFQSKKDHGARCLQFSSTSPHFDLGSLFLSLKHRRKRTQEAVLRLATECLEDSPRVHRLGRLRGGGSQSVSFSGESERESGDSTQARFWSSFAVGVGDTGFLNCQAWILPRFFLALQVSLSKPGTRIEGFTYERWRNARRRTRHAVRSANRM